MILNYVEEERMCTKQEINNLEKLIYNDIKHLVGSIFPWKDQHKQ